ncbi:hypothetical protein EVAR_16090_1 [Eumeta japonica]|uniref:Uncharacterized protein n=1 Tax=Eumeta variegata TaxID=151549 RepID=A0A4C1UIJ1_EUMVA|nr:hypothetical protein EVAR_16090_1 [Eumeta japonica]
MGSSEIISSKSKAEPKFGSRPKSKSEDGTEIGRCKRLKSSFLPTQTELRAEAIRFIKYTRANSISVEIHGTKEHLVQYEYNEALITGCVNNPNEI